MKADGVPAANTPAAGSRNVWATRARFAAMRVEHLGEVQAVERLAHPVGAWDVAAFTHAIHQGHECRMAWCGERAVGHAVMAAAEGQAHLLNLCVRPAAQRRGHGTALVRHMIECARRRGATSLTLEVRPSNIRAGRLYHTLGFREIGRRKNFYRLPKEAARLLELRLDGDNPDSPAPRPGTLSDSL